MYRVPTALISVDSRMHMPMIDAPMIDGMKAGAEFPGYLLASLSLRLL